ncbi:hypothetical protein [Bergeyella cardium]|uniref:Uncharacterized protein n=1 Tax=Bergeyella cardium TaxID=1585976 RepID=A0A6P1QUW6_9FLAO|nr:hypothetical protein [Bergeyella cardium]QHN64853.1 hypothetical protein DBX24_02570 [Bergeyella cardium]WHE34162.1 hypothetical protein P8603_02590 [Bergeyella cardium]WHF60813.1 hypothetical protein O0R51_02585 [Bergeyella cardium]
MPANFPEAWLNRVIQNLNNADQASFLEGISEINAEIHTINPGTATEKNKIYVPTTEFEVDVLINNNSYPIAFQEYSDDSVEISLDKYQTKVITLPDDKTLGASYDIIDTATKSITRGIKVDKYQRAIHSIAPLSHTVKTPVIEATGGSNNLTDPSGRKRLTYEDLVAAREATEGFGECRLVLCPTHWNDLLLDRKNFGNQLIDYAKGKPQPMIAGFEIHKYDGKMPIYKSDKTKKPYGAIKEATDKIASVIFVKEAIAKKTGITKQYFVKAENNPPRQSNDLAYRHYYIATPYRAEKIAAII